MTYFGSSTARSAMTAANIGDGVVTTAKINDDAVTSAKIADGVVVASDIATDTITADKIAAGAVGTSELAADSVTAAKIGDDVINSEHYVDASIDNAHIADDAVGVDELSATGTASSSTFLRGDNSWAAPGSGLTGGGTEAIFLEGEQQIDTSYAITSGFNAWTTGPVTVASGVTVTVTSGCTWTVG